MRSRQLNLPAPYGDDWRSWARQLVVALTEGSTGERDVTPAPVMFEHQISGVLARAEEEGIGMYDAALQRLVLSIDGEWKEFYSGEEVLALINSTRQWVAANFSLAGYSSMGGVGVEIMDDLDAAFQAIDNYAGGLDLPPRGMTMDPTTGYFSLTYPGIYSLSFSGAFTHNELNAGRTTNVRVYDVTGDLAGENFLIVSARNVTATTVNIQVLLSISEAQAGRDYVVQIGGGDGYSSCQWEYKSLAINHEAEWRYPVPPVTDVP